MLNQVGTYRFFKFDKKNSLSLFPTLLKTTFYLDGIGLLLSEEFDKKISTAKRG
jgi:hypothetical protein